MSKLSPAFVLGYHGCDEEIAEKIFAGGDLKASVNDYDWLGSGIYFWEADPDRAFEWAIGQRNSGKLKKPAIVGAVIDLGNCLNLSTREGAELVGGAYHAYRIIREKDGKTLPLNTNPKGKDGPDRLLRRLDNAIIEQVHSIVAEQSKADSAIQRFDTVRAMFREGEPIYPDAGFWQKTHVQIAVRNTKSVVGYFRPRKLRR